MICNFITIIMKSITKDQENSIISLASQGLSCRHIAAATGLGKSTIARHLKTALPDRKKLSAGRSSKLTSRDKHAIIHQIITGKVDNAVQATKFINSVTTTPVHPQTVRNTLKSAGLRAVTKKKKPLLKLVHRQSRLAFARKYKDWTVEDWKRVIWSDETKINRIGSDGQDYIWKRRGEGLIDREIEGTVKFGGGSLMLWGCIGWSGTGLAYQVQGRMDSKQYTKILEEYLLPSIQKLGVPRDRVIFQQDNDPKHTSKVTQEWLQRHGMKTLDWPSQSPDLNPIEHTWYHLKRCLSAYDNPPEGIQDLWTRVVVEWAKISVEQCQAWIESMPRRIKAVIKAKGGHTKY